MGGGVGGLAAGYSKASKQVRLVEREVCFISDAGKGGGRVADLCPKAGLPTPEQGENFYNVLGGGMQKQHSRLQQSPSGWSSVV